MFFWDLNKSQYIKNDYETYARHNSYVSCIINAHNKEKETLFSASHDGLIIIWEVETEEIKVSKSKREKNEFTERDLLLFNKKENSDVRKKQSVFDDFLLPKIENKHMMKTARNLKDNGLTSRNNMEHNLNTNYKYIPQIKLVINTSVIHNNHNNSGDLIQFIKGKNEINAILYLRDKNAIYSGGSDCNIHIWDAEKGKHLKLFTGHKTAVVCMAMDKNYIFSGSLDSQIIIWNTFDDSFLMTLGEASMYNHIRIFDILMISFYGILVSVTNDKKVHFWKYETRELLVSKQLKQEVICLALVEAYGKLLCGTRDKTIIEIDLATILEELKISHNYQKFHFLSDKINYEIDSRDKDIDNFKIMKSLTKGMFD